MVRCRLDGRRTTARRARCATCRSASSSSGSYLMETRHGRQVTVEEVSIWVPEDAAALELGLRRRGPGAGAARCASSSPGPHGRARARRALSSRPRPIPRPRRRCCATTRARRPRACSAPRPATSFPAQRPRAEPAEPSPEPPGPRARAVALTPRLIPIDGARGEGGGQILRTALALSAVTGQGFEITRIRAGRTRPGLRPQHVAAVRAVALVCGARVGGVFDGSPDLRFEPGAARAPGDFRFEIATAGRADPGPADRAGRRWPGRRGRAGSRSPGARTCPRAPPSTTWRGTGRRRSSALGLRVALAARARRLLSRRAAARSAPRCEPWAGAAEPLVLEERGALVAVRGRRRAPARLKGDVARAPARGGAGAALGGAPARVDLGGGRACPRRRRAPSCCWRRVFEQGRAAFGFLGERGVRAEVAGRPGRAHAAQVPGRRGRRRSAPRRPARGAAGPRGRRAAA